MGQSHPEEESGSISPPPCKEKREAGYDEDVAQPLPPREHTAIFTGAFVCARGVFWRLAGSSSILPKDDPCHRMTGAGDEGVPQLFSSAVIETLGTTLRAFPPAGSAPLITLDRRAERKPLFFSPPKRNPRRHVQEKGFPFCFSPLAVRARCLHRVTRMPRASDPGLSEHRVPARFLGPVAPPSYYSPFLKPPGSCRSRPKS